MGATYRTARPLDYHEVAIRGYPHDAYQGLSLTGETISLVVRLGLWWLILRVILWVMS